MAGGSIEMQEEPGIMKTESIKLTENQAENDPEYYEEEAPE